MKCTYGMLYYHEQIAVRNYCLVDPRLDAVTDRPFTCLCANRQASQTATDINWNPRHIRYRTACLCTGSFTNAISIFDDPATFQYEHATRVVVLAHANQSPYCPGSSGRAEGTVVQEATAAGRRWQANHCHLPPPLRLSMYVDLQQHYCYQFLYTWLIRAWPVAEKTFIQFRALANKYPDIHFIAVSHSNEEATDKWVIEVGGQWSVEIIVDESRELYAEWGLGISTAWHVLNPGAIGSLYTLAKKEGISNRPTESGNRWQTSGSWAVDGEGIVRWGKAAARANEIPDFTEALTTVGVVVKKKQGPIRGTDASSGFL